MTDTYGMIDEKTLEANSLAISDAILSTVYQSNVSLAHNREFYVYSHLQIELRSMKMVCQCPLIL